ncbi:hypothetical protein WN943_018184 [Citrus x changshan-huyou]
MSKSNGRKQLSTTRSLVTVRPFETSAYSSTGDNFYEDGLTGEDDPAFLDSFTSIYTAPVCHTQPSSNRNKFENSETKFSNDQLRTMDRHSHRRRHHRSDFADQRLTELARAPNKRFNINTTRLAKILATGLIILPILVILSLITRQHPLITPLD